MFEWALPGRGRRGGAGGRGRAGQVTLMYSGNVLLIGTVPDPTIPGPIPGPIPAPPPYPSVSVWGVGPCVRAAVNGIGMAFCSVAGAGDTAGDTAGGLLLALLSSAGRFNPRRCESRPLCSPLCWSCGVCAVAKSAAAGASAAADDDAASTGLVVARAAWSRRSNPACAILGLAAPCSILRV